MFDRLFGKQSSPLVEAAFGHVSSMLDHSGRMLDLALAALLDNQPLDADLDSMDDRVDEGERLVRRSILEHLSVAPQHDLVASLVLASMVQDAERIGDFARGLGELIPLAGSPRGGPFADRLRAAAGRIRPLFGLCEEAFREDDSEKARVVVTSHLEIKQELGDITRDVAASDLTADMAVVYAIAARVLRRVSAHLSNIASSVVQPYDRIRHGDEEA
ncbi:MAG TPA: PhoU domain-containing protein [Thermoanaerobaculia bacterium]|nr:PhoU domain-containing protein [Thermoanaerobaculia bacterium]